MRVDPNFVSNLANSINQSKNLEAQLAQELSSGLRVSSLQDDPLAVAQSLQMDSAIARNDTFVRTASTETSLMQVADSTLGEMVSQLTSAVTLAVQGSNGTLNTANITAIGQQLTGIRDQVLALANTSYQGQYLFDGSQGGAKPFTLDTSAVPATVSYAGDAALQYVETPDGQKIQVNMPGSALAGSGIFGALSQLIADFSDGSVSASAAADSSALTAALGALSSQRSVLDSSLSRLQSTSAYAQTQEAQLKVQQGALIAADPVAIATQLKAVEVQNQALLSVVSSLQKLNLFDYLH